MQEILDQIVEKVPDLTSEERRDLIQLLQEEEQKSKTNGKKGYVSPNTIWVKEHHAEYAGKHVALKDGELIAVGATIKEVDLQAKEKGIENPLLTYLFPLDREPLGS
jgi:Family of unknown function (DUF5678)